MRRRRVALFGATVALALAAAAVVVGLNLRDESPPGEDPREGTAAQIERGAYLARLGNCGGCHTARGGAAYAGGRAIETPFGLVFASNLTPDERTGIGRWSPGHFWRALHNGRSMDGRLLYPAFPYPNYTQVGRADADAIYAYLRSLPPVEQPNRAHALRFPYNLQASLAVWRALFFVPGIYRSDAARSAEWNRGGYLVRGLAHCGACHGGRNLLGATSESLEMSGGLLPMQNWYAPALNSPHEAGVADWDVAEVVELLKTGRTAHASVLGPMAEVVYRSTQYVGDADLRAMAVFLKDLPQAGAPGEPARAPEPAQMALGRRLYDDRCAGCHGRDGQGAPGRYAALAGNRAVLLDPPANLVRVIVSGGFTPATAGHPRPFGMPPFGPELDDAQIAAVATYVRAAWGNAASPVTRLQVMRYR